MLRDCLKLFFFRFLLLFVFFLESGKQDPDLPICLPVCLPLNLTV